MPTGRPALGQIHVADPAILLQGGKDTKIRAVQFGHISSPWRSRAQYRAKVAASTSEDRKDMPAARMA
jgi:hypothetical protein